ncbi:MAG: PIG-L deacetylase family protein [Acidimicrobiales bacterium]
MVVRAVLSETPRRALAIYAHPDDADISCGGTLAKWAAEGSEVHVLLCAAGDKGSVDAGDDASEVARHRLDEARRATELLGVRSLYHLDRPDGEIENDTQTRAELVERIRKIKPDVVVCPDPSAVFFGTHHYNHRDHRAVGWATLDSVAPAAASPLYFPQAGVAYQVATVLMSGSLEPNLWVDVTSTIELKVRAVACHESQLLDANDWFASALRDGAEEAGREAGVLFAEAFRRLELT